MEKRKNNVALRAAIVLCVLALFCAAFVGGTFAKYVTNDNADDSARVAKWGITLTIGGSLFGTDYQAGITEDSIAVVASDNVNSSGEIDGISNIVAPGTTSDKGLTIKLDGTPEVQYAVTASNAAIEQIYLNKGTYAVLIEAVDVTEENYTPATYYVEESGAYKLEEGTATFDDTKTYYVLNDQAEVTEAQYRPLVWTVANTNFDAVTTSNDLEAVANDINEGLVNASDKANEAIDGSYTLKWAWAYEGQNDGADTILGNLMDAGLDGTVVKLQDDGSYKAAVATTDYNLEVAYDITVEVTQVD